MKYDQDKVDEITMALLYLGMSRTEAGGRAWKGFDLQTMVRLHQKGWIDKPRIKDISVNVTPEGVKKAEELFRRYCQ
jgi:hypothetical protein